VPTLTIYEKPACSSCSDRTGAPARRRERQDRPRQRLSRLIAAPSRLLRELEHVDAALYAAVASTPTPALDRSMRQLSDAANYSRLSIASAAVLALAGGPSGRRAAASGLASVAAAATVVNIAVKPLSGRRRPDRSAKRVPLDRHVRMPVSTSFPSGHSAAAFAFATGVGHVMPTAAIPLSVLATLVAYSRVHTGVHYPGDVVGGSLMGIACAQIITYAIDRRWDVSGRP
jgi:membrane-associated phospholipid phosphatase